jgi:hypothetical protein
MRAEYSWITKDNQFHQQNALGVQSCIVFFLKLFFDDEVVSIHFKKLETQIKTHE